MTVQEIRALDREMLKPADVAEVLGCEAYAINLQAKADAAKLGFPVCVTGTRVKIPRRAFLNWLERGNAPEVLSAEDARREFDRLRDMYLQELEERLDMRADGRTVAQA